MPRPRFDETDKEFEARTARRGRYIGYGLLAVLLTASWMVLYPVWLGSRPQPVLTRALGAMKQVGLAVQMYASDTDDHLPLAPRWMDALSPYARDEWCLHSLGAEASVSNPDDVYGIAFRRSLSGSAIAKIDAPEQVVLIFDSSDLRRNAAGELSLLPIPPRYGRDNVVCFVDGRASYTPEPGVVLK